MNNENFQFLADNIKYAGFGENLRADLEKAMGEGKPEFQLHFAAEFYKKSFEAALNFRRSESSGMYYFNNYRASLQRINGEKLEQTFYLNKGKGVTAKEAFNLLDGRAVHKDMVTKEGHSYKAWLQLDTENKDHHNNFEVKQYHENYGFDVQAALSGLAISELNDPQKSKDLVQSLQKGNVQSVTIEKEGSVHKMFVEADPKFKNVKLYDAEMRLISKEGLGAYQSAAKEAVVKNVMEEGGNYKKKEVQETVSPDKEKMKNSNQLLPKKSEGTKKGLGRA